MRPPPKTIYMATYHCVLVDRMVKGRSIIDEEGVRVGSLEELKMSLQNTRDMTISNLQFWKYKLVK